MASQSRPPVVLVEWLDASAENEQMNVKVGIERMQLDRRYSLGFLVHNFPPAQAKPTLALQRPRVQDHRLAAHLRLHQGHRLGERRS